MRAMVVMMAALVAALWLVVLTAGDSNAGFADNAAAVTFVGAVALGIERVLEVFWLVAGRIERLGGWWPLDTVRKAADEFETEAKKLLGEQGPLGDLEHMIRQARTAAERGDQAAAETLARLEEVKRVKDSISARMDRALQLSPGSSRLSLVSRLVTEAGEFVEQSTTYTGQSLDVARSRLAVAQTGMQEALDVIDAFQDNPARRLASLMLGSILGLGIAGATSLNLFTATLAEDAGLLGGSAGVALTGIVLGFGAGPTHEIVKGLQRYKERKEPTTVIVSGGLVAPTRSNGATTASPPAEHNLDEVVRSARMGVSVNAPSAAIAPEAAAFAPESGAASGDVTLAEGSDAEAVVAPMLPGRSVHRIRCTD